MTLTARLTPELIRALFTEALKLEFGIRLPIEAVYHDKARTMISAVMKGDPKRDEVMLCAFPKDNELWFVRKTVEVIV